MASDLSVSKGFKIKNKLWIYPGDAAWHFVYISDSATAAIKKHVAGLARRGFGAVKVEVTLGKSKWRTSIFPTKEGEYLLPIKASVRRAEGICDGDMLSFTIRLV